MKTSSLESKTIRPGLNAYSFYHSDRHLQRTVAPVKPAKKSGKAKRRLLLILALALIGFGGFRALNMNDGGQQASTTSSGPSKQAAAIATAPTSTNNCMGNDIPQLVKISITKRHQWVCEGDKQVRDYPVITGMQNIAENATPPGTYKVYAKATDTVLSGTSSTGSWREPVSHWMPFLDNEYGTYGFHDASWRKASEFGNTDPYSTNGSHGCVQMSVASSEWLYNWANVGATVTITL
ncbi:MAG: ErfK/YbiS/YcfS/YnhG family protein [Candidatus Saccharibacteria bacterium]|nr:ErfK/YbiS/YcfS/YnhG family protein [Candidatus Saccharibacteria bacterium]